VSFYIFKLNELHVKHSRGNIPDQDVITFSIFVNQLDRGHGTGIFNGMVAADYSVPADAVPPNNRFNMDNHWQVGPLEIAPGDGIHVIYSGTNISDEQLTSLSTQQQDEIELKILSAVAAAAVEALTGGIGLVGTGIAAALGAIGDPVRKFLGFAPQGPCNGPVFSDAVQFSGSGLDNLNMVPLGQQQATPPLPSYSTISFTRTYTDEATHDPNICGHIAETDVTFSVLRVSFISVAWSMTDRGWFPSGGLRQHGQPGTTISVKSLFGLRP
jgi:hypothetical protein